MTSAGTVAGAAIGVAFAGVALGVTGKIVKDSNRRLRLKKKRSVRLRRSGII